MIALKIKRSLAEFLNAKADQYNQPSFIESDPISIPHGFTKKQDIEIAGFFAAIFSWGNRTTIIRKTRELMQLMDNSPHQFVLHHTDKDLKRLPGFRHRTFNATDLYYFIEFFKHHYSHYESLEDAFLRSAPEAGSIPPASPASMGNGHRGYGSLSTAENGRAGPGLAGFYHYFFSLEDFPPRTRKHIASPEKNSSCKRLNMFLRWMVRKDDKGVDFGIWEKISPSLLICPLDVHVARVARHFGLLSRKQTDWEAALELTGHLIGLDKDDPVKYDFALFGLGAIEKF